jgi:biotin operon repressor
MDAFGVRDGMFSVLRDGSYRLGPSAIALLWFMLFQGVYDPGSRWYGFVDTRFASQEVLAIAVRRSVRAVRTGLEELEEEGFIVRSHRYHHGTGNRLPDSIKLQIPSDFCLNCRSKGHNRDVCTQPLRDADE